MKALFVNVKDCRIEETEIKDWREISPKIGCDLFTCLEIENDETLYLDDEGLINGKWGANESFYLKGYPQILMGNALLLGTDKEGESTSTKMTIEELKKRIVFNS